MSLGVILAGGQARRMGGGDKGRLMLGGQSLFERVIQRLAPQVAAICLNANGDLARFQDVGLPIIPDSLPGHLGPLAGILAGLEQAVSLGHKDIVTVAVDTPFFPHDLVEKLKTAQGASGLALAATQDSQVIWPHPTFGLWPVSLAGDLRAALGDGVRKILQWTDRHQPGFAVFPFKAGDPFFNINTPDDLARAEALL